MSRVRSAPSLSLRVTLMCSRRSAQSALTVHRLSAYCYHLTPTHGPCRMVPSFPTANTSPAELPQISARPLLLPVSICFQALPS